MSPDLLPKAFKDRMKNDLKDEYDAFMASYGDKRVYGLRCNTLKGTCDELKSSLPIDLTNVSWAFEGFYYDENDRPGKHPLHEAGADYIQEPSAMSAVSVLDPGAGDVVLDLCAAPGGKSTQIAARLNGTGLLVSNEIVKSRSLILSSNIERMGVRNAVVTNEDPERLKSFFPAFFDKILVDAPCSGEGMFRKDETAIGEWSEENVDMCAKRQAGILDCAADMLKPGGVMVYSTCTFSFAENDDNIESFINRHPDFSLISKEHFYPHRIKGEGHFVAKLVKAGTLEKTVCKISAEPPRSKGKKNSVSLISAEDIKNILNGEFKIKKESAGDILKDTRVTAFGENIYLTPSLMPDLKGLNVVRPGLNVLTDKGKRFEPAHSLMISLRTFEVTDSVTVGLDDAKKFIAGETINCDPSIKGWIPVFINNYSTGFGKASNGIVKNHYPKGLRIIL